MSETSRRKFLAAAGVGALLNRAGWVGPHTRFPEGGGVNAFAAVVAVATFSGMVRWNWNLVKVVAAGALLGLARGLVMGG